MARRILVIGGGGREHALAWRLARDPGGPRVWVTPGNDGIARDFPRLDASVDDGRALARACRAAGVDLVVVGPEAPLAAGVVDALERHRIPAFGPRRAAAALEASKAFAKEVMRSARVPTAAARVFEDPLEARAALATAGPPWVVKADGLAAGKGVCVTSDRAEAEAFLADCLERGRFGAGGRRVLIEEFLEGEEASVMAVCDGARFVMLPAARDHKRAYDGDRGPNTGGMGAWAPVPRVDAGLEDEIGARIVAPVLGAMRARGAPFRGVLYCGLMLTAGGPRVLEFNVRFGDPETQAVLPLVEGDLGALLASAARGTLDASAVRRAPGAAVAVVLVEENYPGPPRAGGAIEGLGDPGAGVTVFHAGTRAAGGRWEIAGGRAVTVMACGASLDAARERVYGAIQRLGGSGWRCRGDVAGVGPARGQEGSMAKRGSAPRPRVGIVMGSESDRAVMEEAGRVLEQHGVPFELVVRSAHRTPGEAAAWARDAQARGIAVIIAGAGGAAHLAGAMAANSPLPVLGVPLASSPLGGFDALLSTVQMPPGVPVGTLGVGSWGARNAAHLALRILALGDPALAPACAPAGAAAAPQGAAGARRRARAVGSPASRGAVQRRRAAWKS